MADPFEGMATGMDGPASHHYTVVPLDNTELPTIPRALYAASAGDIAIRDVQDAAPIVYTVAAGAVLPFRAWGIDATGTTATVIAWY